MTLPISEFVWTIESVMICIVEQHKLLVNSEKTSFIQKDQSEVVE